MILGVDVVFIHVKNPDAMAKWYHEKLGLEITFKTPDNSWQEISFSQTNQKTRFALDYGGVQSSEVEQQPIMISFKVDDITTLVASLEQMQVEFFNEKKIIDVGPTLVATIKDPEGNWIQLSQRKSK